ncbi:hypothetical protein ASPCAL11721 [Aspergillus calidoustus]|uniref:Uncharacterized protein n=1 Tax=Aspergillus calidoustus TaxID=454130 RepID=A0A0U5CET5_ASPCI|nr:hypothetical protein ASPCAL11721 [Aspergillus calidoustus]
MDSEAAIENGDCKPTRARAPHRAPFGIPRPAWCGPHPARLQRCHLLLPTGVSTTSHPQNGETTDAAMAQHSVPPDSAPIL